LYPLLRDGTVRLTEKLCWWVVVIRKLSQVGWILSVSTVSKVQCNLKL